MAVEVLNERVIRLPQGDTGVVRFVAEAPVSSEDKGVFTLARRNGAAILRKILPIDADGESFVMAFTHEDTANLRPDRYEWSFRIVRSATAGGELAGIERQGTPIRAGRLIVARVAGGVR